MLVIAVRTPNEKADKLALAHEYDHLAANFKDKANELRGASEPAKRPKKLF